MMSNMPLPGKLAALHLHVSDAVQYQLEDVAHGSVEDRAFVLIDDPAQDLLLAPGVVDRGPRLGLYRHDLLHDARPPVEDADELAIHLVYPDPELPDPRLRIRILPHSRRFYLKAGQPVST